ncbi:MAG: hypothetical protein ACI8WT_001927 [Clostridium sp.]
MAGGKPAKIYYYNTDINARTIIKTVTNSLHSWVQPDLPGAAYAKMIFHTLIKTYGHKCNNLGSKVS